MPVAWAVDEPAQPVRDLVGLLPQQRRGDVAGPPLLPSP